MVIKNWKLSTCIWKEGLRLGISLAHSLAATSDGLSFVEKWSGDFRIKNRTLQWRRQAKSNHHWRAFLEKFEDRGFVTQMCQRITYCQVSLVD